MKNILITGAGRGIGFDLVLYFLDKGHRVIATSMDIEKLKTIEHEHLTAISLDLTTGDFSAIESQLSTLKTLDILINNAGSLINKPFGDLSLADWQEMFEVNIFRAAQLTQSVFPYLKAANKSHIVNIGSMGGFQGSSKFPGLSAYSASKAALACWTECLAVELSEFGISSNCLALGAVNTEMLKAAFPNYKAPVESHEMASFIGDFSLNGSSFFNGQVLPIALKNPGE
jgi:3-oxoacyl-[acyl-carrier protein] reductase